MDKLLLNLKSLINIENFKSYGHLFIYSGFCAMLHPQKLFCVLGSVSLINRGQNGLNPISSGNNKVQYLQKSHYIEY